MLPYWIFLFFPIIGLVFFQKLWGRQPLLISFFAWLFLTAIVGFRHEVGGDWFNYANHFSLRSAYSFFDVLFGGDPGYYLLNYFVAALGGNIYIVNLVCAAIVMAGVVSFSNRQPLPWLALIVAMPYLVIVVSMGYTRQATALGFLLLGLVALSDQKSRLFVFWVVLGATFHKSAVLMLPIAALASSKNRFWNLFWIGIVSLGAAYFFVFDSAERLWTNYVEADYESQGGLTRVLMNAVPALCFLCLRRYLNIKGNESRLWFWMSIFALICIPLVLLSSTATDRVALYLIPLQLYVFSRIHLVTSDSYARSIIVLAIVAYYCVVQFVWLNFASHVNAWLPYQMYPFAS